MEKYNFPRHGSLIHKNVDGDGFHLTDQILKECPYYELTKLLQDCVLSSLKGNTLFRGYNSLLLPIIPVYTTAKTRIS